MNLEVKSMPIKSDTQEFSVQNNELPIAEIGPNTISEEYEPCHSEYEPCHSKTSNEVRRVPGRPRKLKTGTPGCPKKVYNLRKNQDNLSAEGSTGLNRNLKIISWWNSGMAKISFEETMASDHYEEREDTILSEISSLVKSDTWDIVERNQHIIESHINEQVQHKWYCK